MGLGSQGRLESVTMARERTRFVVPGIRPISEAIEESSGRDVAIGSVYITLDRLERKGLVSSRLGEPTAERGGRAKTYFRITAKGLREVQQARQTLNRLWDGVPRLQGGTI